ncbi:MAG TPA: acyltransferase [Plantibacter sp.]|uniref:acyltransferase family protein n=1 Tax=unclassified Plantibacter TaxID=2624265 RepID=UPI002D10D414|nr:acyltransferase [Plantibacter sp.]
MSTAPRDESTTTTVDLAGRDLALDLVRVACVVTVVIIHLLMVAVAVDPDGTIGISRALEQQSWFDVGTWFGQIMPLFFIVGGFATITGWRSTVRRGGGAADFLRSRVFRLALPTVPVLMFLAAALWLAQTLGVDPSIVNAVAAGVGSPLWFLAAYLLCQAVAPVLARCHGRRPILTCVVLLTGVVVVDLARYTSGLEGIGLVNLLFVWPLLQQFGFFMADGRLRTIPRPVLIVVAAASICALVPLTSSLPYSTSMLGNLNPPTLPLVVLGIGQLALLTLVHPLLTAVMRSRIPRVTVFVIGSRLMTVYLWHVPMIILVAGCQLLVGIPFAEPMTAAWWWTRPVILLVVGILLAGVGALFGRFEHPRRLTLDPANRPPGLAVWIALASAFAMPFAEISHQLTATMAALGAAGSILAVILLTPTRRAMAPPAAPVTPDRG